MQLDPVRLRVIRLISDRKTDLKSVSLAIGRNAAYMQQFLYRGTPKVLPEDVRETLARHLEVEGDTLRHREVPPRGEHMRDEPAERPPINQCRQPRARPPRDSSR